MIFRRRALFRALRILFALLLLAVIFVKIASTAIVARGEEYLLKAAAGEVRRRIVSVCGECVDSSDTSYESFASVIRGEGGEVLSFEIDSAAAANLQEEVLSKLGDFLGGKASVTVFLPLFSVFFGIGGEIPLKIPVKIPLSGEANADISSEFTGAALNQSKYRVTLDISASLCFIFPSGRREVCVSAQIPLSEIVIVASLGISASGDFVSRS